MERGDKPQYFADLIFRMFEKHRRVLEVAKRCYPGIGKFSDINVLSHVVERISYNPQNLTFQYFHDPEQPGEEVSCSDIRQLVEYIEEKLGELPPLENQITVFGSVGINSLMDLLKE